MPDVEMRKSLVRIELESRPISDDIDYDTLAQITEGYNDYDYTKEVERIIYIDNNLYTLSEGLIKATNIDNMEEKGSIEIKIETE